MEEVKKESRTYTQEEVSAIVEQFNIQFNNAKQQIAEMAAIIDSKRVDYLFKVLEYALEFDDDVVSKAKTEIVDSLFAKETETNE